MPDEQDLPNIPLLEDINLTEFDAIKDSVVMTDYSLDLETHEAASYRLDLEKKQHELDVERAMLPERKKYALCLFLVSVVWLAFIGTCVWNAGRQFLIVSDAVLVALITTTTINVLGLFYIVARWLFPHKNRDSDNKNN